MVLVLESASQPAAPRAASGIELLDLLLRDQELREGCNRFIRRASRDVGDDCANVHVVQGEWAEVAMPQDCRVLLGSTGATTCCVAVLCDKATRTASVSHHGPKVLATLASMHAPAFYLAGGYSRACGTGQRLCAALLSELHQARQPITLKLLCIAEFNTSEGGAPLCQSLVVDPLAQQAWRVGEWRDRGPLLHARMAQFWYDTGAAGSMPHVRLLPESPPRLQLTVTRGRLSLPLRLHLEVRIIE